MTNLSFFKSDLRRMGVYFTEMGSNELHIHADDCTGEQERKTTALAKQYNLEISLTDKGALFTARWSELKMTTFQVGKSYATRSICSYDTIFAFTILSRTAKTVTVKVNGKIVRRGLSIWNGVEQFKPFGNYSMCAIIGADDVMYQPGQKEW